MKKTLLSTIGSLLASGTLALAQAPQAPPTLSLVAAEDAPVPAAMASKAPAHDFGHSQAACAPGFWINADYLYWCFAESEITTPLVTSGPDNVLFSGVLDQPGTVVLFPGAGGLDYGGLSGWRLTLGAWLDDEGCCGIEVSAFATDTGRDSFALAADANGRPFFGRPFINALTGSPNLYFVSQNFTDPALDANLTGAIAIESTSRLWSGEINAVRACSRQKYFSSQVSAGWRSIGLDEDLRIAEVLRGVGGGGSGFFLGAPVGPGEAVATFDSFDTRTRFNGPQIGGRAEWRRGCVLVGLTGKLAVGISHQELRIAGGTARVDAAGNVVATAPGGVLAVASNFGRRNEDELAIVPEIGINLGYEFRPGLIARLGYNFLYLSSAARVAQQIDPVINPGLVPSDAAFGTPGPARPFGWIDSTDFWAHGLNVGVEVRY